MDTILEQAIAYIKAGDLEKGKQLLIQVIQQNPREENAWLWMSRCVSGVEQKKECFKRALAINPKNEMTQKALEKLSSPTPSVQMPSAATTTTTQQPVAATTATRQPIIPAVQPSKQKPQTVNKSSVDRNTRPPKKKGISSKIWLPIVLAIITCCGSIVAAFVGSDTVKTIVTGIIPRPDNFTISVHVADKSGSTISGAKVLFFYPAGSLSLYTDSNGVSTFNITNAGQGNLRVIVETDDYQIFEKQVVYPIETTIDVRLSEKQGSNKNVILRAVADGSNTPIAGIDVVVTLDGNIYRQATDSDGFALFELPFPSEGEIDTQISVNAQGYGIENQFSTLTPGKLQYILLSPNSLRIEAPDIPVYASTTVTLPTAQPVDISGGVVGSGVETYQQAGGSGLKIIALTPDSEPWNDAYFDIYEQKTDATGKPSKGGQVDYGRINLQGELIFDLNEGIYSICPPGMGYGWTDDGCVYNIQVVTGSQTVVKIQPGKIEVTIVDASGNPWNDIYGEIYTQKQNAVGKPVTDAQVWYGRTDNTGTSNAWLTPGIYAVKIDLRGYNWGELADTHGKANISVNKGTTTPVVITMGQVVIGLSNESREPLQDTYMEIYTQKNDVNGNPILDGQAWYGRTDNGGLATISLTEGLYALKIGDNILYNLPVNWGVITRTDGKTYQQTK